MITVEKSCLQNLRESVEHVELSLEVTVVPSAPDPVSTASIGHN